LLRKVFVEEGRVEGRGKGPASSSADRSTEGQFEAGKDGAER